MYRFEATLMRRPQSEGAVMKKRSLRAALPVALAIAIAGCGGTPGQDKQKQSSAGTPAAKIKTDGFESLGPVTLRAVVSDAPAGIVGIKRLSKQFEAKYPNVRIKLSVRDYVSWSKQIKLVASGDNPPDILEGGQGYQLDGTLVKAGLILPLDNYAKAYGWEKSFSEEALQQLKWSKDGRTFGEGPLWGIAQGGETVGVFANLAKLRKAGVDPAALKTFDDFDAALAKVKGSLPPNEPTIMLGNKEQWALLHLWAGIQGAYEPAQNMRDWIFHKPGATFDTPGNRKALAKLKEWNDKGYFGRGGDFNGRGGEDATNFFARGKGAFLLGGNWNALPVREGLKDNGAFFNMPPGPSGKLATWGSLGLPYHISVKTKYPDVAAAWINHIAGRPASQVLVQTDRVPAILDATAKPTGKMAREVTQAWQQLVRAGGLMLYIDWSSPTMLTTTGQAFQEFLAGRASLDDMIKRVQKDWSDFDSELRAQ
jgi:raffinose/stachyose/melibiose transport system substrate-binding protein